VNPAKGCGTDVAPLHLAAQQGHLEVMKLLLTAGAKVNFADRQGRVPLHFASRNNKVDCILHLLSQNANGMSLFCSC